MRLAALLLSALIVSARADSPPADPYRWLEDVEGDRALAWVREQNAETFEALREHPLYEELYAEALDILTSETRIPAGFIVGDEYHNFWQDGTHVRGIWRATPLDDFIGGEPEWRTILSIDELARRENENWVYEDVDCVGGDSDRCLVELSRGGTDESVYREFSRRSGTFVDGGFVVPEAKSNVAWLGEDALLVATDWGDGSLTNSGYAREVRLWSRGQALDESEPLFTGAIEDTLVAPLVFHTAHGDYPFIVRLPADWNEPEYLPLVEGRVGDALPIPRRVSLEGVLDGLAILRLQQDWVGGDRTFRTGDVVAFDLEDASTELVLSPAPEQAVVEIGIGRSALFVEMLDDVAGRIRQVARRDDGWSPADIGLPDNGVVSLVATSARRNDLFVDYESAVQPTTLYYASAENDLVMVDAIEPMYDSSDVEIRQRFAVSKDGTRVPYFVFGRAGVLERGDAPTILYGYGGFEIPVLPIYYEDPARPQHGALAGRLWVSRGGVMALANLRGGGEYGPGWHQAALRENRQRAYDDYFAIAEDLVDSGLADRERLGALGRSNGGLLLGVALTQRPDLFAALDIGVPLLDMRRYSKLLAGASWMGEYGDPDVPADWAFIRNYSPYQNLDPDVDYPTVLFYTSTKDDRVHPGHARKMAAKLEALGEDFYYYENIEGGHGGTANQEQLAMRTALEYAYFMRMLMPGRWQAAGSE